MTIHGLWLVAIAAMNAAISSFLLRHSIDQAGGFSFNGQTFHTLARSPLFLIGVCLYGLAGLLWFRVLATEQLSIAYPLLVSLTFVLVTCGAILFFGENLTIAKLTGLGLILSGIALVAKAG